MFNLFSISLFNLLQYIIRCSLVAFNICHKAELQLHFGFPDSIPTLVGRRFLDSTVEFCPFFCPLCSAFRGWRTIRKILLSQTGLLIHPHLCLMHLHLCLSIRTVLTPEDNSFLSALTFQICLQKDSIYQFSV